MTVRVLVGDAVSVLRTLPAESVQLCVTSPPYFSLRAYGTDPQVWGGDPEHGHEWGTYRVTGVTGGIGAGMLMARGDRTPEASARDQERLMRMRSTPDRDAAFCPCGAWRGELGSEPNPGLFIEHLLLIFDEVKRVLRPDGLCFVNLGDSYSGSGKGPQTSTSTLAQGRVARLGDQSSLAKRGAELRQGFVNVKTQGSGIPAKNLLLIPQRFAIAMQERGWVVRSEIVWAKTSAMPESVRDRPTSAWEPIWMFAKSQRYSYDGDAVRQPHADPARGVAHRESFNPHNGRLDDPTKKQQVAWVPAVREYHPGGANLRNVWSLGPSAFADAHFATFVPEIPRRCILAGTSEKGACPACGAPWVKTIERTFYGNRRRIKDGSADLTMGRNLNDLGGQSFYTKEYVPPRVTGWQPSCSCDAGPPIPQTVLDPFGGSGTTGLVADRLGRDAVLVELNPEYAEMARRRIEQDAGALFGDPVSVEAAAQLDLFGSEVAG